MKYIVKTSLILLAILLSSNQWVMSQQIPDWSRFNHLLGQWIGQGTGSPGEGRGGFTFSFDLDQKILVRKGHTEFPAANGRPASAHDDLMVVYPDFGGNPVNAIYWDNEGHTIEYSVTFTGKAVIFTSAAVEGKPVFRLSYETIDPSTVNVKFEMADPQKPGEFKVYLEGKSVKTI